MDSLDMYMSYGLKWFTHKNVQGMQSIWEATQWICEEKQGK